ncbi:MAG: hypothetical protein KDJ15_06185 [Alphaproteobacteria bacterium]|nr:hypothetical protein [Alphaproteobacteria bacterium]
MARLFSLLLCLYVLCLSGCGTTGQENSDTGPLLPLPVAGAVHDPDNDAFMKAVAGYIAQKGGPAQSRYEFTRIDLDGDGRREGLLLLKSPHGVWCGVDGCRMAIFRAYDDDFALLSEVTPVRGPLTVSESRTHGWRDLIVRVSGRMDLETRDAFLRFDGRTYPASPLRQPALYASSALPGVRIFP